MQDSVLSATAGDGRPTAPSLSLSAPISGWVTPLSEVPDAVFAERVLGDGIAIEPVTATLYAPCDGTLLSVHRGRHALTLRAENGAEILIHIGIDTIGLNGRGFLSHVAEGQAVRAGDPLVGFDLDALALQVKSMVVPMILINGDRFAIKLRQVAGEIVVGAPLLEILPIGAQAASDPESGAMVRREVTLRDAHGIHARPAGLLAERAKRFSAVVTFALNGRNANARSPVSLMLLDAQRGDTVTICATGADADAAVRDLADMIEVGLDPATAPASPVPESPAMPAPAAAVAEFTASQRVPLSGMPGAPGHAVGHAVRLTSDIPEIVEQGNGPTVEIRALEAAIRTACAEVQATIDGLGGKAGPQAEILNAHLSFLGDPDLLEVARGLIDDGKSAAFAWHAAIERQIAELRRLGNALLIERASDLADIDRRVLLHLLGESDGSRALPEDAILVADDLLPSQLTGLNRDHVAGICLAGGGPTSHVSIMAASMGIPALVAVGPEALRIPDRAAIILDCEVGTALVHPSPEELREASETVAKRRRRSEENRKLAQADCRTADGVRIQVMANLGALADVAPALANGAEGCGLLRSEFLFIDRPTAPDENEQFAQYQSIASALEGRPLVIRTLDAGGDKDLPYVNLPRSDNPALGLRGVRMSFWQPDLLRAQLRAILRVRPVGQCAILLPMIATLGDLRTVRAMLDEEKARLKVSAEVPLGIMVEVPSAALISEQLAAEADFLSVGTNDLTQYTFAMDRTSAPLAKYLDPFHPAILHLIAATARGAERHRRWVGVCGGLASQPLAAPLLIGLGATELSVIPQVVARIKALVHGLTMADCREAARHALTLESGEAVRDFLAKRWPDA